MGIYQTLTVEKSGRVAVVTFRRADQLNAMNRLMQGEITTAFEALSRDDGVGAIVVTGEGRGFMAGAVWVAYSLMSAPAMKPRPSPVTTIAPIPSSLDNASKAAMISPCISRFMALSWSARRNVTIATRPDVSTVRVW